MGAIFSPCRKYRYAIWRNWNESIPRALIIGLNPSTADENNDDPTILRCMRFAKSWGYGGVSVANLFAYCASNPREMLKVVDPIGIDNDQILFNLAKDAGLIVAAWGNKGSFMGRSDYIARSLQNLMCLKINKSGEPAHPLYLKSSSELISL